MDGNGWLLAVLVTAASAQDRDGGHRLVALLRERFSTITLVRAGGGDRPTAAGAVGVVPLVPGLGSEMASE